MNDLFWNTVTEDMRLVLSGFSQTSIGARFYLGGGTARSLQLGHRRSVDLDFFSPTEDIPSIRPMLEEALAPFQPALADSAWGNLVYLSQNVRVGFYGYGFPLVAPLIETEDARLCSVEDIALMKMDALLSRAARKDFYDLYFICQKVNLRRLLELAPRKYPNVRDFEAQVVKRLVYFENAEADADPIFFQPVAWQATKEFFIQQAKAIGTSWLE
ncbi:MAG: nucleotidyl transferase AbiEii/AbiGii toxin family protein [Anaerolineales bacterium]|nr:nucleotidyl transferase AbiEii/AbiGii toxin family protein [Anaerolineales bacterium]